jgi:FkbM family methyltransferase
MKNVDQPKKNHHLIFDVGMHKGEDTDYYLKKGFHVIAFEADPNLVAACKIRFAKELQNGKLVIVEGAIVDFSEENNQPKTVNFFRNNDVSVWGTVSSDWAFRNESLGTSNVIIEVPAVNFSNYLKQYGIPYYLKIDIEGMDAICLNALQDFEEKPDYISIESEKVSFNKLQEEFDLFAKLGYSKFQAVDQSIVTKQREPKNSKEGQFVGYTFEKGSSGLFGSDLPNKWKTQNQILTVYKRIFIGYKILGDYSQLRNYKIGILLLKVIDKLAPKPIPGWYDTHAKHGSVTSSNRI